MNYIDNKRLYMSIMSGIRHGILESFDFQADGSDYADDEDADMVENQMISPLDAMEDNGIVTNDQYTTAVEMPPITTADGVKHGVVALEREHGTGNPDNGANWIYVNIGKKERSGRYYRPNSIHWKDIDKNQDHALYSYITYIRENPEVFKIRNGELNKYPYVVYVTIDKQVMKFSSYDKYMPADGKNMRFVYFYTLINPGMQKNNGGTAKQLAKEYVEAIKPVFDELVKAKQENDKAYQEYYAKKQKVQSVENRLKMFPWLFFEERKSGSRDDLFSDFEIKQYADTPAKMVEYLKGKYKL